MVTEKQVFDALKVIRDYCTEKDDICGYFCPLWAFCDTRLGRVAPVDWDIEDFE